MLSNYHFMCQPTSVRNSSSNLITVRKASVDDADAVAAIYSEHVHTGTASFDTVPLSTAETAQKIADTTAKGWPFLVVTHETEVVAYAYVTQFRDRRAYGFTCEDSIYVRSDQAGNGIGSTLMRALIEASTACGFRQMMAVIGGGEPASVALHAKMGFEQVGQMRSVGRKFRRWLDTVYMQLELGEGDGTPPEREPV